MVDKSSPDLGASTKTIGSRQKFLDLLQAFAQFGAGAAHARFNRAQGHAGDAGYFLVIVSFDIAQHGRDPLIIR